MSALISDRDLVTLESSDALWRAAVHPVGATLVSLTFDGADIAISPYDKTFYAFAGATLAPWPNRLEDGTWVFADKTLKHEINDERGHNANHGLVFDREFAIKSADANSITLQIELGADPVYPFQITVEVNFELSNGGLTQKISILNRDSVLVPVAFGSHPYLTLDEDSQVEINAREIYGKSTRSLPLDKISIDESTVARFGFNSASDLELDDCFTGLTENDMSRYSTRITRPSINKTVEIWQEKLFDHLMLFVFRESTEGGRLAIAVEPQTAPANALRSNQGLTWLAPSQSVSASWGVSIKEGLAND